MPIAVNTVWIGYDRRETEAFAVARHTIESFNRHIPIRGLLLSQLQRKGFYRRPTVYSLGRIYDEISKTKDYNGAMSTEFAISRFLTPHLAKQEFPQSQWALFMDPDVLVRANLTELFSELDTSKALYCVQHDHKPTRDSKMDAQEQTKYFRKNWSSVTAFNVQHPANARLTLDVVNTLPGRDLHRFCWVEDDEIGALDPTWNHLDGFSEGDDPKIVHYTEGGPWLSGFENRPHAAEWQDALERWVCR